MEKINSRRNFIKTGISAGLLISPIASFAQGLNWLHEDSLSESGEFSLRKLEKILPGYQLPNTNEFSTNNYKSTYSIYSLYVLGSKKHLTAGELQLERSLKGSQIDTQFNKLKLFIYLTNPSFIYRNLFAKSSKMDYFSTNFKAFFNAYFPAVLPLFNHLISFKGYDMLKMIDVLDQRLVQNFTQALQSPTSQFEEQLDQGILNASDLELNHAVTAFFNEVDAIEAAQALDISADRIQALQLGASFKDEQYLADLKKIVTLCLALETDALEQVEVFDSLQDYPM